MRRLAHSARPLHRGFLAARSHPHRVSDVAWAHCGGKRHNSSSNVVTLAYEDLRLGRDLTQEVARAYGPDGLGVLTVSGVPGLTEARERLLPLAHSVAHLEDHKLRALEHEESMWNAGWSHGKEKLGDEPDLAKGSYYANPVSDEAGSQLERARYPFFYPPNLWPDENDVPGMDTAFKAGGRIMYDTSVLLSKQLDNLVSSRIHTYEPVLHTEMSTTDKVKGRLLYYFPTDNTASEDAWIGWHNDSGFLTVLMSDMYVNDETGEIIPNPDPDGGLWIVERGGGSVKVDIPDDHLAIQCGECLQVLSGGLLVATPHAVRASKAPPGVRVARASFPVFVDVRPTYPLTAPPGVTREEVLQHSPKSKVPPLASRWTHDGMSFVDFLGSTFTQYYEWAKSGK